MGNKSLGILHFPEWLKALLITWGVVSLLAAPLVGVYLRGARLKNSSARAPQRQMPSHHTPLEEEREQKSTQCPEPAADLQTQEESQSVSRRQIN